MSSTWKIYPKESGIQTRTMDGISWVAEFIEPRMMPNGNVLKGVLGYPSEEEAIDALHISVKEMSTL